MSLPEDHVAWTALGGRRLFLDVEPEVLAEEAMHDEDERLPRAARATWDDFRDRLLMHGEITGVSEPGRGLPPEQLVAVLRARGLDQGYRHALAMRRAAAGRGDVRGVRFWADVLDGMSRAGN